MRVLLDTIVLVSHLLTSERAGAIATIFDALGNGEFVLLVPLPLLDELDRVVTQKPSLARYIQPEQLAALRGILLDIGEVVPPISGVLPIVSRDRKDDYLLAYAVVGEADYVVTGDEDLLVLKRLDKLQILSPPAFAALLRDKES